MEETYKEIKIRYEEQSDQWLASVGGQNKIYESLKAAKKAIDYAVKKVFERIPCWVQRGGYWKKENYEKGMITSLNQHGEIWVTFSEKDREKYHRHDKIWGDTPENILKILRIHELVNQVKVAETEIETLTKKLIPALEEK